MEVKITTVEHSEVEPPGNGQTVMIDFSIKVIKFQETVGTILNPSNRKPKRSVVVYTSCHGTTIVMSNCIIAPKECSSGCYHAI